MALRFLTLSSALSFPANQAVRNRPSSKIHLAIYSVSVYRHRFFPSFVWAPIFIDCSAHAGRRVVDDSEADSRFIFRNSDAG